MFKCLLSEVQYEVTVPTVSDRIAQAVVKGYLEPEVEKHFHPDSYGYRPGKSALDAVGVARKRCWRYDWALDLDIRSYFDSISHELLLRAVRKHTDCAWVLLYIERWLKAPVRGWMSYYGRYYKSAHYPTLRYLNRCLARWAMAKYKRLKRHKRQAEHWVRKVSLRDPKLFAHWSMLAGNGWTGRAG